MIYILIFLYYKKKSKLFKYIYYKCLKMKMFYYNICIELN